MTGKTHMLGGLAAGAGLILVANNVLPAGMEELVPAGLFIVSSTMTALLPDVDEINSTAGRKFIIIPITLFIIKAVLRIFEFFTLGKIKRKLREIRTALNHRGVFHWLITWAVLSFIFFITTVVVLVVFKENMTQAVRSIVTLLIGFIPGYLSHLLLDMISGRIQLLAPFSKKWYGIRIIETGGFLETYIFRPALIAAIVYMLTLIVK